jgi:hypothetical protein
LLVLIRHLPADSATRRALDAESVWGLNEQLLAAVVDGLHAGNWQRGGGKGKRPEPIARPGIHRRRQRVGHTDRDPAQVAAYLARFKPPPPAPPVEVLRGC